MRNNTVIDQLHIDFPEQLLVELNELVPVNLHNQFIVNVVNKELRCLRLLQALEESFGAWSLEDHPDLATSDDIDAYVRKMREAWMPRTWDEIAAEGETDS